MHWQRQACRKWVQQMRKLVNGYFPRESREGGFDSHVDTLLLSIRYTPGTHPIGSNSMMPRELGGVVSPELLVYGSSVCSHLLCSCCSSFHRNNKSSNSRCICHSAECVPTYDIGFIRGSRESGGDDLAGCCSRKRRINKASDGRRPAVAIRTIFEYKHISLVFS